jgi:hypothetical protein
VIVEQVTLIDPGGKKKEGRRVEDPAPAGHCPWRRACSPQACAENLSEAVPAHYLIPTGFTVHIFGLRQAVLAAFGGLPENTCFPLSSPRLQPDRQESATTCFSAKTTAAAFPLCPLMCISRSFH